MLSKYSLPFYVDDVERLREYVSSNFRYFLKPHIFLIELIANFGKIVATLLLFPDLVLIKEMYITYFYP